MNNQLKVYHCPDCGAVMKDWWHFSEKSPLDMEKPFECTGFRCGKRWKLEEILQKQEGENENREKE